MTDRGAPCARMVDKVTDCIRAASTLASHTRWHGADDPRTVAARSTMARAQIERDLSRVSVAELSDEDRAAVIALLTTPA